MRATRIATCIDCKNSWDKRADSFKDWDGRCRKCAQSYRGSLPAERERRSLHAKNLLERIGKITNCGGSGKRGYKSPSWKGGKPQCIDCGERLATYSAWRCRECAGVFRRGVRRPAEVIEKLRAAQKKGPDNPLWKGGPKPEWKRPVTLETRRWSMDVRRRDNFTCQECGYVQPAGEKRTLHADHIKPWALYPELRYDIDNGRTLCASCHRKTPTFGVHTAQLMMARY